MRSYISVRRSAGPGTVARRIALTLLGLTVTVGAIAAGGAPPRGTSFTVSNIDDAGGGSFRQAILDANANPGADTILFRVPFSGPHTIRPDSPLPVITDSLTIDGYSQPGASANELDRGNDAVLRIELDGSAAGAADGLSIAAGNCLVRGLAIGGFQGSGIVVDGPGGNRIEGNFIGTDSAGTVAMPNGSGLLVRSSGNVIGGASPPERNIIAFQEGAGVLVASGTGNRIEGNAIHSNIGPGIDLGADGETPNDVLDGDSGPNDLQNSPELATISVVPGPKGGSTTIEGSLTGIPETTFTIEFFFATPQDPAKAPRGIHRLGSAVVTTGVDGRAAFLATLPVAAPSRAPVTATATGPSGSTSEFADSITAPTLTITWNTGTGNWGTAANWNPVQVPGSLDTAVIAANGGNTTFTVTLDVAATVGGLTLGGGAGTQTLSIASPTLTLNGASTSNANGVLSQSGGTITGVGSLTLNGPYNWSGGTMSGAATTTANGAVSLSGVGTKVLSTNRTLNNAATATWTGTGTMQVGTGAVINNAGTWDAQNDVSISNPFGGTAAFNNSGTLKKSVGTLTTTIAIAVNNTGTVNAQSGMLILSGGGTSTGGFTSASGKTLEFGGGTHDLNSPASVTGAGTVRESAGTTNVNSGASWTVTGPTEITGGTLNFNSGATATLATVTHSGGTLGGTGSVTVSGLYNWTAGTMSGAAATTANGGIALSGTGTKAVTTNRTLNSPATATWTGTGTIQVGTGAVINNTGTWDVQNDVTMNNPFGGTVSFTNAGGTFRKSAGAGTTTISIPFANNGTVDVQTGTVAFSTGGSSTGSFNVSGALATMQFSAGTFDLNAGTTLSGPGTVLVSAGTVNVNGAVSSAVATTFSFTAGTLGGTGTLTLSGPLAWAGGTMTAAGITNANGGIALSGSSTKVLVTNRTLNNAATATWTGAGTMQVGAGAVINNTGTWDVQNDVTMNNPFGGTAVFNNPGTLKKSAGTLTTALSLTVNNTGTVNAQSGTLTLGGGGTSTGSFTSASGKTLEFGGGTHDLNSGAGITGAGTVRESAGTTNVNTGASWTVTGPTEITGGTLNFNSGATATLATVTQSAGTLGGTGSMSASGLYTWSAGTMTAAGITNANGGMALSGVGTKTLVTNRILNNNAATATWTGTGLIQIGAGSVINNTGTWDIQNDVTINNPFGGTAAFNNSGTLKKSAGTLTTTLSITVNNTGAVNAQSGTLILGGGGTSTGSFTSASGQILEFGGGTHDLNSGAGITGAGTVRESAGTTNVNTGASWTVTGPTEITGGTLNFNSGSTATLATVTQSAGTLGGTGSMSASGLYTWSAGTMTAAGITNANGGMALSGVSTKTLNTNRILNNNAATATWTGTGLIQIGAGSVINNTGTWDIQNDVTINNPFGGTAAFNNSGTLKKSAGTLSTTLSITVNNTGTVNAQSGTLTLGGGGTSTGSFTSASGQVLEFGAGTHILNSGAGVTGAGTVRESAGTTSVNSGAAWTVAGPTEIASGTLNFNAGATATLATVTHSGGTLGGTGSVTVSGLYTWTAGTMTAAGITNANGGMALSGVGTKTLSTNRILNNNAATAIWTGTGLIQIGSGSVINNTGTWDVQNDATMNNPFGGTAAFMNAGGTFRKSAGAGSTSISIPFTTSGTVDLQSGTLNMGSSSYTQTAGITKLTGGALSATASINIQGGSLAGTGTVTAPVIVSGTGAMAPGLSAGTLSMVGNYTQQAPNTAFNVELGGTTPGTQYDRVDISGTGSNATLAGALNVSYINAFTPVTGDTFTIMTWPNHTGTFVPNLPLVNCILLQPTYGPTSLVLTAVHLPIEVGGLLMNPNKLNLTWAAAPAYPGTTYDVLRGGLTTLPVGPGAGETCLASGITATTTNDAATPAPGQGFWYLIRERITTCGIGTYGFASSGTERVSTGCP